MTTYKPKGRENDRKRPPKRKGKYVPKLRNKEENGEEINNDPNWYFSNAMLAEQVSRFSFNQFLGIPFTLSGLGGPSSEIKLPTVMKIQVNPSAGWTDPTTPQRSGVNTAGFKLYTTLSARNAKTTSYAPQDVTILTLALGSLLSMVSYMRRFFGLTYVYSIRNRAYAKYVCEVMGLNFTDFIANRADYLAQFNYYLNTINKIAFPANIPYFDKCRSLFDDVYVDAESTMAQSYVMVPYSVWTYDEAYDTDGAGLRTTVVPTAYGSVAFSQLLSMLNTMIDALLSSTALNYIYSDVLTLAAKEHIPMLTIPLVPDNYGITPQYSANFCLQIKNATIVGQPLPSSLAYPDGMHFTIDNDVKCNATANCIWYTPQFRNGIPTFGLDHILDFPYDNPDVTNIIEATRFAVRAQAILNGGIYYTNQISLGDQYIVMISVYNTDQVASISVSASGAILNSANYSSIIENILQFDHFSAAPRFYLYDSTGTIYNRVSGDTTYFTTVGEEYLSRVDDICLQGLFDLR